MHFLICDLGNTRTKVALYHNDQLTELFILNETSPESFAHLLTNAKFNRIDAAIVSSVSHDTTPYLNLINAPRVVTLTEHTSLPLTNEYSTPATLGNDRIAGAVGAAALYPGKDILVVDLGTAITYDFVEKGKIYKGGSISPGISMRFKALNAFTMRLPLLTPAHDIPLIGTNTAGAISSGVMNGCLTEVYGTIEAYRKLYPKIIIILTGGDLIYFEKMLKNNIFAHPNLIVWGLKQILTYNLEK
ncbi:MAG: type III pantothenate kinase [Lentimicrobiaceae bacterium]|nr:type III pantothenate kinase [Lentimicrobiaceae bacterium]